MQPNTCSQYLGAMIIGPIVFGWLIYSFFAIFRFITLTNFQSEFGPFRVLFDSNFYKGLGLGLLWLLLVFISAKLLPFWGFNLLFFAQMIWVSRQSSTKAIPKIRLRLHFAIPLFAFPWLYVLLSTSAGSEDHPLPSA